MRPIALTLATKGIISYEQEIPMATKGVLDLIRVGGGSPHPIGQEYIEQVLCLRGKKVFDYADLQCLFGLKEFIYEDSLCVLGKKLFDYEVIKDILGQKQYEILFKAYFKACKRFGYGKEVIVDGKKSSIICLDYEGLGSKMSDLTPKILELSSKKSYLSKITRTLSGGKELSIVYAKEIRGKKDLTPIIIALMELE